jgi:prepilin-type N-terminal cleavage/methylation domain-containing protein
MTAVLRTAGRRGFTLVELLIVLAIILVLTALGAAFFPTISDGVRVANGADRMQGWLLIAKQRAKRDARPTGLRLQTYTNSNLNVFSTQVEYIQQPDDFAPAGSRCTAEAGSSVTLTMPTGYVFAQYGGATSADQNDIQGGDYIEFYGGGPVHQIQSASASGNVVTLTLVPGTSAIPSVPASANVSTSPSQPNYRIIRAPRPLAGEPTLVFPTDVGVDLSTDQTGLFPLSNVPKRTTATANGSISVYEILFSPNGSVVGSGTDAGQIYFWIRDITANTNAPNDRTTGRATLVSVQVRSGFIGSYPALPGPAATTNPYQLSLDGRDSGL